ncbi:MAG: FAD-binding oxidoreductase [Planctomycetaceae bacterium]
MKTPDPLPSEISAVVGPEFIRLATPADAIDGIQPRFVVEPATPSEVARVLAVANAAGLNVIPRGGGTKLDWGNPPRGADIVLSLKRLDQILEHAAGDMTATVETGCTIAALQRTVAERGQRLALDPLWPERATVGGVLATGDAGPLRWSFGPPRDLVLGVTVALADGTLARSGGKVVKNVAGYDLPKLFAGSFGTLGVITQATFRLHPLPEAVRTLAFVLSPDGISRFVAAMGECSLLTAAVQVRESKGEPRSACVRIEGLSDAVAAKAERVANAALAAGAIVSDPSDDEWSARERLFEDAGAPFVVGKLAVLPARLGDLFKTLREDASCPVRWRLVMQAMGAGLVRCESVDADALAVAISRLRAAVSSLGGSLVVLRHPPERRDCFDVWGTPGDSLPLMRRVKEQFDPAGTLNPGRFVGGI